MFSHYLGHADRTFRNKTILAQRKAPIAVADEKASVESSLPHEVVAPTSEDTVTPPPQAIVITAKPPVKNPAVATAFAPVAAAQAQIAFEKRQTAEEKATLAALSAYKDKIMEEMKRGKQFSSDDLVAVYKQAKMYVPEIFCEAQSCKIVHSTNAYNVLRSHRQGIITYINSKIASNSKSAHNKSTPFYAKLLAEMNNPDTEMGKFFSTSVYKAAFVSFKQKTGITTPEPTLEETRKFATRISNYGSLND